MYVCIDMIYPCILAIKAEVFMDHTAVVCKYTYTSYTISDDGDSTYVHGAMHCLYNYVILAVYQL